MTWPEACTPASVRPAALIFTGSRKSELSTRSSSPATVRNSGWNFKTQKFVPLHSTRARYVGTAYASGGLGGDAVRDGAFLVEVEQVGPGGDVGAIRRDFVAQLEEVALGRRAFFRRVLEPLAVERLDLAVFFGVHVRRDELADFRIVARALDHVEQRVAVEIEKFEQMLVHRPIVVVFADRPRSLGLTLVDRALELDDAVHRFTNARGISLGEIHDGNF